MFPISYALMDSYVPGGSLPPPSQRRTHPVVCTLRGCPQCVGTNVWWKAPADSRLQVMRWTKEAVAAWPELRGGSGSHVGELNKGGREQTAADKAQNSEDF